MPRNPCSARPGLVAGGSVRPRSSPAPRCFNPGMARVFGGLLSLLSVGIVAATLTVATGAPALATPAADEGSGIADPHADPGAIRARITFLKKPAHPWNSRITWRAQRQRTDGTWKILAKDWWRAESGLPGGSTTNPCVKGHGWLPDGRYTLRQYDDYAGSLIRGRAFRLS